MPDVAPMAGPIAESAFPITFETVGETLPDIAGIGAALGDVSGGEAAYGPGGFPAGTFEGGVVPVGMDMTGTYGGGGGIDFSKFREMAGAAGGLSSLFELLTKGRRAGLSPTAFPFGAPDERFAFPGGGTAAGGLVEPQSLARILGGTKGAPATASSSAAVPGVTPPGGTTAAVPGVGIGGAEGGTMDLESLMELLRGMS